MYAHTHFPHSNEICSSQQLLSSLTLRHWCQVTKRMGIDYATWRARIGLNNYRQCRYYHPLPVQWRAARWGVGEVMNDTPLVLQGCIVVVTLTLILEYTFCSWRICPKGRGRCGKVRCPKLGGGSVLSAEARGMVGVASGVHLILQLCVVVLALLLMAGDVERNPGPPKKEGRTYIVYGVKFCVWFMFVTMLSTGISGHHPIVLLATPTSTEGC